MMNKCLSLSPPDLSPLSLHSLKTRAFLCKVEIIGLTCFGGEKVNDHSKGQSCSEEENKTEERTEVILSRIRKLESCALDWTRLDRTTYPWRTAKQKQKTRWRACQKVKQVSKIFICNFKQMFSEENVQVCTWTASIIIFICLRISYYSFSL